MLSLAALFGFGLAVAPLVVTPGASFTLVSARGLAGDRRGARAVIAGTALGILTHGLFAGVGLAAVVMRSAEAYQILRLVGAVYLVALGSLLVVRAARGQGSSTAVVRPPAKNAAKEIGRAYLANVLNVKAATVYLTLAPQFVPVQSVGVGSMVTLAFVHVLVMAAWLGLWSTGLVAMSARFNIATWKRRIDLAGGAVLVFLGVRSARP
ncbi:LysE family translocator [Corynebacterium genitalium ATCC 33030]|uniref:LysE family translocator n=1 Tax=Corynebacterium TaxID=1716 RepID=UPI00058D2974|nr:LysE family translocator [Corynebacterium genitalium]MCQ4622829.1 LysE family translocator [Corynebacterium sp. CCUG 70398]UUA88730.1 LysE family translocator [Corynebacterium genitalium ATCC 33030]